MKTEFYLSRESSGGRLDRAAYRPWPLRWIPTLVPAAAISMLLGSVPLNAIGNALSESATGVIVRSPLPGGVWALTLGLWVFAVAMCLRNYPSIR